MKIACILISAAWLLEKAVLLNSGDVKLGWCELLLTMIHLVSNPNIMYTYE